METTEIAAVGYAFAMTVLALLTVLLLIRWKSSRASHLLAAASGATVVWGATLALQSLGYVQLPVITVFVEWLRYLAWLFALIAILRRIDRSRVSRRVPPRYWLILFLFIGIPLMYYLVQSTGPLAHTAVVGVGFLLSALILSTTEQIYRNAPVDSVSELNYFCVAVAGMFAYDFLICVSIIAGISVGAEYWAARGYVSTIFSVPLGVGIWRTFRLSFDVQFPRQIIFYTFSLTAIGIYVAIIVIGHHYIRVYGGSWSEVGGIVFVVGAVTFVAVLLASASTRARVRVFLMKTFFPYKYDYRKEWLRFISTLTESGVDKVPATAVRAVAQIVNSRGGIVWIQEQDGEAYLPVGSWRCEIPTMLPIDRDSGLVRFLKNRQWVIDLEEMKRHPSRYEDLQLDSWFLEKEGWWLIVPLLLGNRLFGFILLQRPRVVPSLNFEDHDLLRTVGRHVGTHINQVESDRQIAESRQFGTYNRLTSFLMHDLNNLIAQQSLVVKNAERFRQNPKFVDDAIDTIAHSVSRMKRLMEQLTSGSTSLARQRIDLRKALTSAAKRCRPRQPTPIMQIGDIAIPVQADPERLTTVFEHLIRNAQDASKQDGRIMIEASLTNGVADVSISDTGEGMSADFIRERLFRPFDSTKGSESMGIGAYQARDYVRTLGGQMEVTSEVGIGTTFSVRLPVEE
jgi:putative PEP-CTERM system histidine kinase